jgi:hypothetical protein
MNQAAPEEEAQREYDQKHGHPFAAILVIVVCVFAIGLLLFCFIRYRTTFFGLLGLALMIVGTGVETGRIYVVFRMPRRASFCQTVGFFVMIFAGEMTYIITSSVMHLWNSLMISAIAMQSFHLCLSAFAIGHMRMLPEFDPNQPPEPMGRDMSLVPEAEAVAVESNSSESEEKKTVTGFMSPYENVAAGVTQSGSQYETSDAMAVGNLPDGEAIAFPGHVIAESNEA